MAAAQTVVGFEQLASSPGFERQLAAHCNEAWGIDPELRTLGAEKDYVFRARCRKSGKDFTLRLSHPSRSDTELDLQCAAMAHAFANADGLNLPSPISDQQGAAISLFAFDGLEPVRATLSTWVPGELLVGAKRSETQAQNVGIAIGKLSAALSGFEHPNSKYPMPWDIKQCETIEPLLTAIEDADVRSLVEAALARFVDQTKPALEAAPHQVIHADATPFNVLVSEANHDRVSGIIDFGDVVHSARICDVAVGASYLMQRGNRAMERPAALVRGYEMICPLTVSERELVVPLMEARHAMTTAITIEHAARRPENAAAITKNTDTAIQGLRTLSSASHQEWTAQLLGHEN